MGVSWTEEQKQVIELRGQDILVSAAAGSGKTAVLVERIIRRITDPVNPVEIDRLLVVTFTRAAASEMRERIRAAIERACEEDADNSHLRRQAALIHNAMITTIDSFCLFVVRNHFEEIGLDPNFRIADEGEIRLLELDVLDEVFEKNYEREDNGSFRKLIDAYAGKRNDQAVRDMVLKIFRMSASSPWPEEWIAGLVKPYEVKSEEELVTTEVMSDMAETVGQLLSDMAQELERLRDLAAAADGPAAYVPALESDLEQLVSAAELSGYAELSDFFGKLSFARLPAIRKFEGDPLKKEAVQEGRNRIKKEAEELRKLYFSMNLSEFLDQLATLHPVVEELVELTLQYTKAMAAAKRKKRIVDFSDVEHFALQILVDGKTKQCRRTAGEFRAHFEEIMIDEYQDSNQVQEEIMRAISREEEGGHNMFMVGDVKQSIYRFRLARPELFMEKYESFGAGGKGQKRIDLHRNFRSRREVVDFSNDMFYRLMSADLGRVSYSEEAALYAEASYPECGGMEAELLLFDEADELLDQDEEKRKEGGKRLEARLIASRIDRLMRETKVTDKETGELRPMRCSDIVVLLRSLKDWGSEFVQVFEGLGIPAHVESSTGYFSAVEVQTVLALLRILDNPYQDIPMAAVLRSPMAGLDDEELAEIRIKNPSVPFAAAALRAMEEATEGKLFRFFHLYRSLRQLKDVPIHELLVRVLDETGYGHYAAAMPAGEQRSANLHMLIEKAVAFEKTSYRGLFHFVRYIEQLNKYEIDFGEADVTGENADVVHIMTIHRSKGLEYPVVFVSGLGKRINRADMNERLVVHPELGLGIDAVTVKNGGRFRESCLYRTALARRLLRENLGEELRVLYVALTRAKEKLILTGTVKDLPKTIGKYTGNVKPHQPISYRQRAGAACHLDWILPAMLSYPDKYSVAAADAGELVWDAVESSVKQRLDQEELLAEIAAADDERVSRYGELFSWEYAYRSEAGRKSKYSVSELKHASMVQRLDQKEGEAQTPEFLREKREPCIPDFAKGGRSRTVTDGFGVRPARGALRGTAMHRVMECLDFVGLSKLDTGDLPAVAAFVENELSRMRESGALPDELSELVVSEGIVSFAAGPVALRMAGAAKEGELYREKPFVMQEEGVLVQGIIDVFWREGDKIVLLDYKTDRVEAAEELIWRYETQMKLYADALGRIFSNGGQLVGEVERLIYSFRLQEVIRI